VRLKRIVYVGESPVGMYHAEVEGVGRAVIGSAMRFIEAAQRVLRGYFKIAMPGRFTKVGRSRFRFEFRCSRERFLEVCDLLEADHVTVEKVTSLRRLMR
jgi:hypothetical protein